MFSECFGFGVVPFLTNLDPRVQNARLFRRSFLACVACRVAFQLRTASKLRADRGGPAAAQCPASGQDARRRAAPGAGGARAGGQRGGRGGARAAVRASSVGGVPVCSRCRLNPLYM